MYISIGWYLVLTEAAGASGKKHYRETELFFALSARGYRRAVARGVCHAILVIGTPPGGATVVDDVVGVISVCEADEHRPHPGHPATYVIVSAHDTSQSNTAPPANYCHRNKHPLHIFHCQSLCSRRSKKKIKSRRIALLLRQYTPI